MSDVSGHDEAPQPTVLEGPGVEPGGAPASAADRMRAAWGRRAETDYIFEYWTALGWTILTLGIYGLYVIYQLVRRMRDHNLRRLEFLDAALANAWEEAERRGLGEELTPSFQRGAAHLAVMRQMAGDFREPAVWLILAIVVRGIVEIVLFILLDGDLVNHDRAEVGVEYELALIYGRFGLEVAGPDQTRVKAPDNYVGRVVATILSLGFYLLWWYHDQMNVPNKHFEANWVQEDLLLQAAGALG